MKKLVKKNFLLASVGFVASFATIAPVLSNVNTNQISVVNNNSLNTVNTQFKEGSSLIKVKSIASPGLNETQKKNIKNIYKRKPSELLAKETNSNGNYDEIPSAISPISLFNILEFDKNSVYDLDLTNVGDYQYAPKIVNLSSANQALNYLKQDDQVSSYPPDTPLEYFKNIKNKDGTETPITQNLMDEYGILVLMVEMSKRGTPNDKIYEYITISGFNNSLDRNFSSQNTVLPGTEYVNSVVSISNAKLESYPVFVGPEKAQPTSRKLVSRVNDSINGTINYTLNFKYDIPKFLEVNEDRISSISVIKNYRGAQKSAYNTYFEHEFILKGFQRSSNVTKTDIFLIIGGIILSGVLISLVIWLVSLLTRKIRNKRTEVY